MITGNILKARTLLSRRVSDINIVSHPNPSSKVVISTQRALYND